MVRKGGADMKRSVADEMVQGLVEFAEDLKNNVDIAKKYRCHSPKLQLKTRRYTAARVRKIRKLLGTDQSLFAQLLGVNVDTVRAWEAGENSPNETACRFM